MDNQELMYKRDMYKRMIDIGEGDWLVQNLYSLFDMSLEVNQLDIPSDIQECRRVLQIKRVLPVDIIRLSHPELMVFEGLYLIVKGVAIPKNVMKKIGYYRRGYIKLDMLPEGYSYGTLKDTGCGYGFAFSKDDEVSNYITESHGWEFFNLHS